MRRVLLLCLTSLTLFAAFTTPASAGPRAKRWTQILRSAGGSITVPPEWDGIWASEDSVYTCEGAFQGIDSYLDTLCAGQVFGNQESGDPGITFNCTGSATSTTVSITCTGSSEVVPDCTVTISSNSEATRTGDTYVATSLSSFNYAGTAIGCDLIPDDCQRTVTYATRLGPAPIEYCVTPTRASTWGQIKVRYK